MTDARTRAHAADCFDPYKCMSCGCDRTGKWSGQMRACVSHKGSPAYQAALLEQIAAKLGIPT